MATKRISSHLILHRYVFDKKSNISTIHDVLMIASQIFHKLIIHNFYKKEEYQHLHGRCENMWLILKRNNKCQCPIWTSCRWRFAHFELAPDSTITNTTSSENLDATEHPLFLIVNGHHNTMVYFSLNFQKSNETFIKHQKSWIP
jgi:hypothetical protein